MPDMGPANARIALVCGAIYVRLFSSAPWYFPLWYCLFLAGCVTAILRRRSPVSTRIAWLALGIALLGAGGFLARISPTAWIWRATSFCSTPARTLRCASPSRGVSTRWLREDRSGNRPSARSAVTAPPILPPPWAFRGLRRHIQSAYACFPVPQTRSAGWRRAVRGCRPIGHPEAHHPQAHDREPRLSVRRDRDRWRDYGPGRGLDFRPGRDCRAGHSVVHPFPHRKESGRHRGSLEPQLLPAFAISRWLRADDRAGGGGHRAVGYRRQALGRTGMAPDRSRRAETHARLLQPLEPGPGSAHAGASGGIGRTNAGGRLDLRQMGSAERRHRNGAPAAAGGGGGSRAQRRRPGSRNRARDVGDLHCSLGDRVRQAVAPFHPLFIEEPTWREMPQALGEIAAKSPVRWPAAKDWYHATSSSTCWTPRARRSSSPT